MATHRSDPRFALAVAARLTQANIPFTLDYSGGQVAAITCRFGETLDAAIHQQRLQDTDTTLDAGRISAMRAMNWDPQTVQGSARDLPAKDGWS